MHTAKVCRQSANDPKVVCAALRACTAMYHAISRPRLIFDVKDTMVDLYAWHDKTFFARHTRHA